jgi:hypothetical protein
MSDNEADSASYSEPRLKPEDQAKIDEFCSKGVNSVERRPFKPFRMMLLLIGVTIAFSLLSQAIARWSGIY